MHRPTRWLYRVRNLPTLNFYGSWGAEARTIRKILCADGPAAFLCHFGHFALRLLPLARHFKLPLIAHFHGMDASSMLYNDRWYRWSLKRNLTAFTAIVVVNNHQRRWMIEHGANPERVYLIPCGTPIADLSPPIARTSVEPLRIIAVSRLVPSKGLEYTLRAFAQVARAEPRIELQILGDGPDRASLEALTRELGIGALVKFRGFVPPATVREALRTSDIYVQHSIAVGGWVEGFGVSVAEASAAALPVVCTDFGGMAEQVVDGETGFLVPQRDVLAMADAITKLIRDPELRGRLGLAGRQRMLSEYDASRQSEKLERVVLRAIADSHQL